MIFFVGEWNTITEELINSIKAEIKKNNDVVIGVLPGKEDSDKMYKFWSLFEERGIQNKVKILIVPEILRNVQKVILEKNIKIKGNVG